MTLIRTHHLIPYFISSLSHISLSFITTLHPCPTIDYCISVLIDFHGPWKEPVAFPIWANIGSGEVQSPSLGLLPLSLSLSHELSLFRAETRTRDEDKSRHDRGKQQTEENYTERRTPSLKQQNSTTWSNRGQHHAPLTTFDFRLIDHAFAFNYNFALNFLRRGRAFMTEHLYELTLNSPSSKKNYHDSSFLWEIHQPK
jgi:hypothetical protein